MKKCIVIFLLLLTHISHAQTWESLEYDSLKPGLELNPLKGFSTMFNPSNNFPNSIRGRLFGLDTVMLGPNTFDWHAIDNFLEDQANLGKHAYIQVNIDPAFGGTHLPDYLFPLVDTFYYDDPNPDPTKAVDDLCPDWNDPDLMDAMLTFIDSFGVRYDNDPRIFMVHLGLYGMWGEWHIGDVEFVKPEYDMTEENKTLIANAYAEAFPNTYLLARYPENMPEPQDYGYSDGLFFGQSISPDNPFYFHNTLMDNSADLNWKLHPIGGELDPDLQPLIWANWPNTVGQDVTASMDSIRPTWIFAHHNLTNMVSGTDEWDNAIRAQREMGYSLYIDEAKITASGGMPAIEVNIQNKGIAPMYADWDIELAVLNASNEAVPIGTDNWNLNMIQPDVEDNYRSFISNTVLPDGPHTFLLRVINPLEAIATNEVPPFTFANTTQDADLDGWITLGEIIINGGNAGVTPTKVTGITLSHSNETLFKNESLQLIATVLPGSPMGATNPGVTWISNKPRTVSVDENGLVTPGSDSGYGTATISAITQDGGFVAECIVNFDPVMVNIPALIEAEDHINQLGVSEGTCCGGTIFMEEIGTGDFMEYGVIVDTESIFIIDFRVSSDNAAGEISLITDSNDTLTVKNIDNATWWADYQIRTTDAFSLTAGEHILRLAASNGGYNLDWLEFKTVASSYTFLGTTNDDYLLGENWDTGTPPPNRYPGMITIAADCVVPIEYEIVIGKSGTIIINQNVEFRVK